MTTAKAGFRWQNGCGLWRSAGRGLALSVVVLAVACAGGQGGGAPDAGVPGDAVVADLSADLPADAGGLPGDVAGDAAAIGKRTGADAARTKATYPALAGLGASRRLAEEAVAGSVAALEGFGPEAAPLRNLARFVLERDR